MSKITVTYLRVITVDKSPVAMQGEAPLSIPFTLDEDLETYGDGLLAYVEFCTPDGRIVEKGPYTITAQMIYTVGVTAFTVALAEDDLVLTNDGEIQIQMIVRDAEEPDTTTIWKSKVLQTTIGKSLS